MTSGLGKTGYRTDPANLKAGAADFQKAAAEDQKAARTIAMGSTSSAGTDDGSSSAIFGVSDQAKHLANKWNSAVAARVAEVNDLASQTDQQADLLLRTANEYDDVEEKNRDRARSVEGGLR